MDEKERARLRRNRELKLQHEREFPEADGGVTDMDPPEDEDAGKASQPEG